MPFLWTPADSSGMGSFLQESVGHGEVLGFQQNLPELMEVGKVLVYLRDD